MGSISAVEDKSHMIEFLLRIEFIELAYSRTLKKASTDNEQGSVGIRSHYLRIDHDIHRRTIKEDIIIFFPCLLYQRAESAAFEQFGRIRGILPIGSIANS